MSQLKMLDPFDVIHMAVKADPDGVCGAGKCLGRSTGVMYNKFAQSMPEYDLTYHEAIALAKAYCPVDFPMAIAEHFGGVFLPLPAGMPADDDVLQSYLDIISQMGALSKEFTEARDDGIIDPDEFKTLQIRATRTVMAIMHLVGDLELLVREVPPPPLSVVKKAGK
jgi:hypothetical protein